MSELYFNSIGKFLKDRFGEKIIKLSLDAGFTCPNRDGTKSTGGCIFCSEEGSGDFAGTIPGQIELLSQKWPKGKYIAYFQSYTNTYKPVDQLRKLYDDALSHENVIGLAIATRPDCLSEEVLTLLEEYNKKTFLWVELGLQTIHESTASLINRCYPLATYSQAIAELSALNIKTVVHLILGLPGENKEKMFDSLNYVCQPNNSELQPFGIKLHMLNVIKGTVLSQMYKENPSILHIPTMEEYINLVVDMIEKTPTNITIHRVTADAPREILIAPEWGYKKRTILNGITHEFRRRGSFQGSKL